MQSNLFLTARAYLLKVGARISRLVSQGAGVLTFNGLGSSRSTSDATIRLSEFSQTFTSGLDPP